jgi:two-component system sensor kinase FixL
MNVVVGHISLVQNHRAKMPPGVADHVDKALEGCENAARTLHNALDSVREGSREKGLVSLPDIARRTVELKGHDLWRDTIGVRVTFAEGFPDVLGVSFQLQQVLLNLVTNAQHALRGSGALRSIEITGAVDGGHAVIEVRDSGSGIPQEALPQIFKPFFTPKPEGTGLGLAVSAAIIRDHGGELAAENLSEGGAVFRIRLPLAVEENARPG